MNGSDDSPNPAYQLRRATLEDLPQLNKLWQEAHLSPTELDKRFTEFQLAIDARGQIAAALGLHINKLHGQIHSEAFADPNLAAEIRPLLWQRILTVAKNNGIVRLWTLPTAKFYREQGMTDIDDTIRARLPEGFGSPMADWITLKLKEENQSAISLEKEFEIFAQAQRDESERLLSQAKAFRVFAYGLLVLALGALGLLAVFLTRMKRKR